MIDDLILRVRCTCVCACVCVCIQRDWKPIVIDDLILRFPWHSATDIDAHLIAQGFTEPPRYELELEGGMRFLNPKP